MSTSDSREGGSGSKGRDKMVEINKGGISPRSLGLNPVSTSSQQTSSHSSWSKRQLAGDTGIPVG